jgi:hypothetical protein
MRNHTARKRTPLIATPIQYATPRGGASLRRRRRLAGEGQEIEDRGIPSVRMAPT